MADGVNRVILVGNLGKDPQVEYTQSGTARCRFTLATGETYSGKNGERQERTEWHNIVVWGKQGENVGKFLSKGRQVYIEGSLRTRSWDDEKTGTKRYMTEVNAQRVVFLGGGRGDGGGGQGAAGSSGGSSGGGGGGGPVGSAGFDSPPPFDDDDIPF
jgi:single-strand DNA-binding protein